MEKVIESFKPEHPSAREGKTFFCGFCGEEVKGQPHRVFDENFNLQDGVSKCAPCLKRELTYESST